MVMDSGSVLLGGLGWLRKLDGVAEANISSRRLIPVEDVEERDGVGDVGTSAGCERSWLPNAAKRVSTVTLDVEVDTSDDAGAAAAEVGSSLAKSLSSSDIPSVLPLDRSEWQDFSCETNDWLMAEADVGELSPAAMKERQDEPGFYGKDGEVTMLWRSYGMTRREVRGPRSIGTISEFLGIRGILFYVGM